MFEARLAQAALLKKVLEAVKEVIEHANLDCSEEGMSLQALDQSHAALVTLKLAAQGFEPYRCDRPLSLGLNMGSMVKIMKVAGANDAVKITAEDDGTADVADFSFEKDGGEQSAHFRLKLMDIEAEHMSVPEDTEYSAVIKMPCGEYKRIVGDLGAIGDAITIDARKASASFSVAGDIGHGAITLHHTPGADGREAVSVEVTSPIKLQCSGKYLVQFAKACPVAESVTICLEDENPICLEFKLPDECGALRYFLAPKVDNDDE